MSNNRDVYVEKIKAKLDEWNAEIDKLEAKSRQKGADMQAAYEERLSELKEKRSSARMKLDTLQSAGESAWEDLKDGVERAARSLGEAIQSAQSRFK